MAASTSDLRAEVDAARWYHAMDLPGGIRTPGDYDLPDTVARIPFPESLAGKRCLDVGTRDGFWAFEMERRGAEEVVAIDLDDPSRIDFPLPRPVLDEDMRSVIASRDRAFDIAHRALGSSVERRDLSVYDLDPKEVGEFDFAFVGTILLHLRNPVDALAAVRGVMRDDGRLMSNDAVSVPLTLLRPRQPTAEIMMIRQKPYWWIPNRAGRLQVVTAAGFDVEDSGGPYLMRYGAGWQQPPLLRNRQLLPQTLLLRRGAPHTWVLARPAR
jgi:tRNA (mo5U34)-methyltransferase